MGDAVIGSVTGVSMEPAFTTRRSARAKVVLTLCLVFALCGCSSSFTGKALNVGVGLAKVADQITTDRAEARGAREGNRFVGDAEWRQIAMSVLGVGGIVVVSRAVEQEHKVLAMVIRSAGMVVFSAAAWHNAGVRR